MSNCDGCTPEEGKRLLEEYKEKKRKEREAQKSTDAVPSIGIKLAGNNYSNSSATGRIQEWLADKIKVKINGDCGADHAAITSGYVQKRTYLYQYYP